MASLAGPAQGPPGFIKSRFFGDFFLPRIPGSSRGPKPHITPPRAFPHTQKAPRPPDGHIWRPEGLFRPQKVKFFFAENSPRIPGTSRGSNTSYNDLQSVFAHAEPTGARSGRPIRRLQQALRRLRGSTYHTAAVGRANSGDQHSRCPNQGRCMPPRARTMAPAITLRRASNARSKHWQIGPWVRKHRTAIVALRIGRSGDVHTHHGPPVHVRSRLPQRKPPPASSLATP